MVTQCLFREVLVSELDMALNFLPPLPGRMMMMIAAAVAAEDVDEVVEVVVALPHLLLSRSCTLFLPLTLAVYGHVMVS